MTASVAQLRKLLRYEPETGKLFWFARPRRLFATDRAFRTWNTRYAGAEAFTAVNGEGYHVGRAFGVQYRANRVIWAIQTGAWPEHEVDHEDRDRLNDRWGNLRPVTHAENARNANLSANSSSGATGVCWDRKNKKWLAHIRVGGLKKNLGRYADKTAAIAARRAAEAEHGFHPNHGKA